MNVTVSESTSIKSNLLAEAWVIASKIKKLKEIKNGARVRGYKKRN
jgi:hypothetical protein